MYLTTVKLVRRSTFDIQWILKTATQANRGTSGCICTQALVVPDDGHVTPLILTYFSLPVSGWRFHKCNTASVKGKNSMSLKIKRSRLYYTYTCRQVVPVEYCHAQIWRTHVLGLRASTGCLYIMYCCPAWQLVVAFWLWSNKDDCDDDWNVSNV